MKKFPILLLGIALIGFLMGLIHLFRLRFESGDNFPPYSSFRADPIGAKAFYESLDSLVGTRRSLQPLARLGDGRDTTLLWLGGNSIRLFPEEFQDLETFVRSGGRLVIASAPLVERPRTNVFATLAASKKGIPLPGGGTPTNAPAGVEGDFRKITIEDRWDVDFGYADLVKAEDHFDPAYAMLKAQETEAASALPGNIFVHSTLWFKPADPDWRVVYARVHGTNEHPVLLERMMGRGSIVLFADSFYFSNEALRDERQPALLSWLIGPGRQVLFEETHLGVAENPGVAMLARKYRLEPLLVAVLLLALLFVWKNAAGFMPPHEEDINRDQGEAVEGRDSASAFVNLLRRNIIPGHLLRICLEQWNAALAGGRKPPRAKLEQMQRLIDAENALEPRQRNPVATYREFCSILTRNPKPGTRNLKTRNPKLP